MMHRGLLAVLGAALSAAASVPAATFNQAAWLADLEQARQAFHENYANWDWAETERGIKIDALFDDLEARMRRARSEAQAMAVFNRLSQKLGDGHVEIDWPEPPRVPQPTPVKSPPPAPDLCSNLGYDARQNGPGTAQAIDRYAPLQTSGSNPFDVGIVTVAGTKVGIVRIGIFQPQGYPELCRTAVREFSIPTDKPCDDHCQDKIVTFAYRRLTGALEQRARQLKAAGAGVLLVDITNNGGGSEWAEAAARIFSPKLLVSERRGFVRGEHWATQWRDLASDLRKHAKKAPRADK